jgi:hypothetical protein
VRTDILIGRQEITCEARRGPSIPSNSYIVRLLSLVHVELEIILSGADGHGKHLREPAILLLTISASTNFLNATATSPSPTTTALSNPGAEEGGARPGDLPTGDNTPVGPVQDGHTEISSTIDRAEEAMKGMDTMTAWEGAIGVIKQVLDTIGPIADVCLIDFPHPLLC